MKRILYEGYYGYKSVGDDSFVEVTAWGANKIWGVNNNYFLSNDLPITQNKVKSLNTQKIRGQNKMEILYQLIKTDTFISSGGSTFEITYPKYHIRNIALRKKKISKKYKIGAIGVSIGPFKSKKDEYNTIHYLKNIDFLALRDNRSFELVQGIDLPYRAIKAFDLAALISNIYDRRRSESNRSMKIIGISINYFERYRPGYNIENEKKKNCVY